ncbi:2-oxo acid dehydrogenase subunit E2 [Atribacter laminatus]|uniref:2-oxoacid dehydrogenase acyltransferase catalytic domain-containing protein n=1 Tax=Atribacter laminatus TaxID=2847778 RepID=A0A7T1AM58_ATRLM|nr:2-oxo acid dehydrogenase subunit E2 [Atribacter laminatus]QPM68429.1 hypothetical protein RT761_01649 [Atribacter laminatus]
MTEKKKEKRFVTRGYRRDGRWLRDIHPLHRLEPFVMRTRNESCIYFREKLDITHTLDYLQKRNQDVSPKEKITLFHVLLAAMVRTAVLKPGLNRFIAGKRIYQRNELQISYMVKQEKTEAAPMLAIKETFEPTDTLDRVVEKVQASVERARLEKSADSESLVKTFSKMPSWLISSIIAVLRWLDTFDLVPESMTRSDPFYASAFVANIGSIGVNAPYHHLYEWGNVSLFVVLGKYAEELKINLEGKLNKKTCVEITFTVDERINDGFYLARALQTFKRLMENPEKLTEPLEGGTESDA